MKLQWKESFLRIRLTMMAHLISWTTITFIYVCLIPVKNIPLHLLMVGTALFLFEAFLYAVGLLIFSYRMRNDGN